MDNDIESLSNCVEEVDANEAFSKTSEHPPYIESSLLILNRCFPQWQHLNQKTIFIPVYHSCIRSNLGPAVGNRYPADFKGQQAERNLFHELEQVVELGGIVVGNVEKSNILKKLPKSIRSVYFENANLLNRGNNHGGKALSTNFQCDFMLLHPSIGIYIMEVKSSDTHGIIDLNHTMYKKAKLQVTILPIKIRLLWEAICGGVKCDVPISAGICFPNSVLPPVPEGVQYDHIDKTLFDAVDGSLARSKKFRQFWLKKIEQSGKHNYFESENFTKFIAAVISSRSVQHIDQTMNALQVAQIIERQQIYMETCKKKRRAVVPKNVSFFGTDIVLTGTQLAANECHDNRQIVIGLPGTGKTLLMLCKSLQAAKDRRDTVGRLYVCSTEHYLPKLEKFFATQKNETRREPIFIAKNSILSMSLEKNDDVIIDEMEGIPEEMSFLQTRMGNTIGKTICAFTGGLFVARKLKNEYTERLREMFGEHYIFHKLEDVMRGSLNIIRFWSQELSEPNSVSIGHTIESAEVEIFSHCSGQHILETVSDCVRQVLTCGIMVGGADGKKNQYGKSLANCLAIVVVHSNEEKFIRDYLNNAEEFSGVRFSTIKDQLDHSDVVAVCKMSEVFSYEWPFVLVCCASYHIEILSWWRLIAYSRAIGKLFLVQYDTYGVQEYLDECFDEEMKEKKFDLLGSNWIKDHLMLANDKLLASSSNSVALKEIGQDTAVKQLMQFINKEAGRLLLCFTIVRHNYLCDEVIIFPGCSPEKLKFTECLKAIGGDREKLLWYAEYASRYRKDVIKINIENEADVSFPKWFSKVSNRNHDLQEVFRWFAPIWCQACKECKSDAEVAITTATELLRFVIVEIVDYFIYCQ